MNLLNNSCDVRTLRLITSPTTANDWRQDKLHRTETGLFLYHGRIVVPHSAKALRDVLKQEYHDPAGHASWRRVLAKIVTKYWWRGITTGIQKYVANCVVCCRDKPER